MSESRKPYPSDVSDDGWALVVPDLTLLPETVGQRSYPRREVFNGLHYIVKTAAPWRWMPNDLPPWEIVISRRNAGFVRDALKHSRRICGCCCVCRPGTTSSRGRRSSTAGHDVPRPRAEPAPGTTAPSAKRDPGCIWPWIRSATCSRSASRLRASEIETPWAKWPRISRPRPMRASRSLSSIKAIQANVPQRPQAPTASN